MGERRESIRVTADGSDVQKEFRQIAKDALEANAAIRAIPNSVTVRSNTRGLDEIEQRARRAQRSTSALVDSAVALWPALIPVSALAVPAVAGLTTQLGFAAAAAGATVLAFHGVGDALKALDAYQLEPTAANLDKLNETMSHLGPSAQAFVREIDSLEPKLRGLKTVAENGVFPGLTDGIDVLLTRLPEAKVLISEVSDTIGDLARQAGQGLAGPGFDDFFVYLERNARPILTDLGQTIGNLFAGMANLLVAFEPAERSFSSFLADSARGFRDWSAGLQRSQGFQDFLSFLAESGPRVADAFGSIGNALVQVVQAGAPLSGVTLEAIARLADVVAKLADSQLGTGLVATAAGLALVNRALATSAAAKDSLVADLVFGKRLDGVRGANAIQRTRANLQGLTTDLQTFRREGVASSRIKNIGKGAGLIGGLALASSNLHDKFALANTASLALAGTIAGPFGAAVGAGAGLILDIKASADQAKQSLEDFKRSLSTTSTSSLLDQKASLSQVKQGTPITPRTSLGQVDKTAGSAAAASAAANAGYDRAREKLAAVNKELDLRNARNGAANMALLRAGLSTTAFGLQTAAESARDFQTRMAALNDTLAGRASLRGYQASLDDLRASLKQNGKTLDINTEKGRANQAALDNIASSAISYAETLKGVARVRFMDNARRQFIEAAVAAGRTRGQAKALANQLLGLDQVKAKPKVDINKAPFDAKGRQVRADLRAMNGATARPVVSVRDQASAILRGVRGLLNGLNGDVATSTIRINTVRQNVNKRPLTQADGGHISGPGGPRDDLIPAWLSNGEYVVRAAAVERYGVGFLDRVNAMAFANGGRVAPPTVTVNNGGYPSAYRLEAGTLSIPGLGDAILSGARLVVADALGDHDELTYARRRDGAA